MSDYETRNTRVSRMVTGEPIFDERTTHVEIADIGGGEYVIVRQNYEPSEPNAIQIDPSEWEGIRDAIEMMIRECRS